MMKKWLLGILLVCCLIIPANAAEIPDNLMDAVPPEAENFLTEMDLDQLDYSAFTDGLGELWNQICDEAWDVIKEQLGGTVLLLLVVMLCGIIDDCLEATENKGVANYVPMAGALVITLIAAGNIESLIGLGIETVEMLDVFSKALLPTLAAAVAATGGVISAGVKQISTVFFANILISLIHGVLLQMVYVYITIAAADAMMPGQRLKQIGEALKKGITWVLAGGLILFTSYLSISGAITGSADTLTVQLTKSAISTAVPVVGGIISDATGSVLAGAGVLKNAVGIFGMLVVIATCLLPFLHLAVQYLLYKFTAYLAGTIGNLQLVGLIESLGSAFGLVLGMTGSCALLLLISIASSVSVVV